MLTIGEVQSAVRARLDLAKKKLAEHDAMAHLDVSSELMEAQDKSWKAYQQLELAQRDVMHAVANVAKAEETVRKHAEAKKLTWGEAAGSDHLDEASEYMGLLGKPGSEDRVAELRAGFAKSAQAWLLKVQASHAEAVEREGAARALRTALFKEAEALETTHTLVAAERWTWKQEITRIEQLVAAKNLELENSTVLGVLDFPEGTAAVRTEVVSGDTRHIAYGSKPSSRVDRHWFRVPEAGSILNGEPTDWVVLDVKATGDGLELVYWEPAKAPAEGS